METQNNVIFELRFLKRLGKSFIENMLRNKLKELLALVKTKRFKTNWDE